MPFDPDVVLALDEPLLELEHAAALLNVQVSWLREAAGAGTLPCIRVGPHLRFKRSLLVRWAVLHPVEIASATETPGQSS